MTYATFGTLQENGYAKFLLIVIIGRHSCFIARLLALDHVCGWILLEFLLEDVVETVTTSELRESFSFFAHFKFKYFFIIQQM